MSEITLSGIVRYPIKSAAGYAMNEAQMDDLGLEGDRRWMIVDQDGNAVTQRDIRALALLQVRGNDDRLELAFEGNAIAVDAPGSNAKQIQTTVWGFTQSAPVAEPGVNEWLSRVLGEPLQLVHCPDDTRRSVEEGYAPASQRIAFSDGYPLLLVGEASLQLLNEKLPREVPMNRFRPNLVVRGAGPHAEDRWRRIRIGTAIVELVKPCARCTVPAVVQETGERDKHVVAALAGYRSTNGEILFGMNGIAAADSRFRVGDELEVLESL